MKVKLKSTFIVRGRRYRRGVHELPDDVVLPKGTEVLDEEEPKSTAPEKRKAKADERQENLL